MRGIIVDSFAGGGGASDGFFRALGRSPDIAINHDPEAIAMHKANHPRCEHYSENVWRVDPVKAVRGRKVFAFWCSPDCRHFSRAKGAAPVSPRVRGLAWVAVHWAKAVRPERIFLENVREFQEWGPLVPKLDTAGNPVSDIHGNPVLIPDPARKGQSFRRFVGKLRNLGYQVEWRDMNAADYGAPTNRKRLFLIARCDGKPIVWPAPTHAPADRCTLLGMQPYRTAAECIDWSLPCPSIFTRKKPLAENTMKRIANGLKRYVFESAYPFIVTCAGDGFRGQGVNEPFKTVTGARLVAAWVVKHFGGVTGCDVEQPLPTTTQRGTQNQVASAFLIRYHGMKNPNEVRGADVRSALPVQTTENRFAQVRAFLIKYYRTATGQDLRAPLDTTTSRARFGLVMIHGEPYQIVDIGMRMLTPRELARAQGFADSYTLTGTKTSQIAKIGNSVPPPIVAAIVGANCIEKRTRVRRKVSA